MQTADYKSSDQRLDLRPKGLPIRLIIVIESVKASIIKDTMMIVVVVMLWVALKLLEAPGGFIAGALAVLVSLTLLRAVLGKTGRIVSVTPENAIDLIEQEINEALYEAKEGKDLI